MKYSNFCKKEGPQLVKKFYIYKKNQRDAAWQYVYL